MMAALEFALRVLSWFFYAFYATWWLAIMECVFGVFLRPFVQDACIVHAGSLSLSWGKLNRTEPSFMLVVTPVLFPLWQVKMSDGLL